MTSKKLKHAGFNIAIGRLVNENWRMLCCIMLILADEYHWGEKRLNRWVDSMAEAVEEYTAHDRDGIYRFKLDGLERRHGDIITRERITAAVLRLTVLHDPIQVKELIDNVQLALLMTVNEFDSVGRKRIAEGFETFDVERARTAKEEAFDRFKLRLEGENDDFYGIFQQRGKEKKEKLTFAEQKRVKATMEAFRRHYDDR